eukprot:scaffold130514_cov79-Cyclotella_meneghiniana.AAC.7
MEEVKLEPWNSTRKTTAPSIKFNNVTRDPATDNWNATPCNNKSAICYHLSPRSHVKFRFPTSIRPNQSPRGRNMSFFNCAALFPPHDNHVFLTFIYLASCVSWRRHANQIISGRRGEVDEGMDGERGVGTASNMWWYVVTGA